MPDFRWIHPDFAELVAAQRLDDLDSVLGRNEGEPIMPGHRNRDTLRVEVPGARRVFYLKREYLVRWKHPLRSLISGQGLWTPARAEFETLARLAAGGVLCPKPIVCLQHVGVKSRGALLVESLPAGQSLIALLAGPLRDADPARREQFFTRLGREVARLHACGVSQPHLYANHVYTITPSESPLSDWKIGFVGFRRSLPRASLTLAKRTADLAALMATLARRLASQRDREAFYDAYLRHSDLEHRGMEVIGGVQRRVDRLLTFRKIWEIRESDTDEHRAIRPLESVASGKMWIDRSFRQPLEEAGIGNFEAMLATTNGARLRALPDRENWRIDLHAPHGEPRGAYLKKHHVRGLDTWLRARVGAGPGLSAGRVEAQNVARLCRSGIAAMKLIAYGEKLHADGLLESFVLTEELVGFTQLDHFLAKRFAPRNRSQATPRDPALLRLLREVAAVANKFHRLGYNHRDLYCCHFFIKEPEPGEFKVNLIDLQRVEHRRRLRGRWLVKDLAQLAYSAPRDRISLSQRMMFIKHYLGVKKLRPQDKRLIRQVLAKQRLMERTLGVAS